MAGFRRPESCTFADMEERWAAVSGGRLRYLVGGSGPPLVLVHGIAASPFSFRLNCAELGSRFTLFVPDLMSPGCSGEANGLGTSLEANAKRLAGFLGNIGLEQPDILGSSHGGAVVMQLAARSPEKLRRMVLVSPANPFAEHYRNVVRFYLSPVGHLFMRLAPYLPGRAWDYGIGRMYADPSRMVAGTGIGYARIVRESGATAYLRGCLKTMADDIENLRSKLPQIARIPTMLLWGDKDPVVEIASGYRLQEALGAEMVVMRGIGHLPYEEAPVEFNQIVIDYLQRDVR